MQKIIIDFQGVNLSKVQQNEIIEILSGDKIEISFRQSKNLSGLETVVISIIGRLAGTYIEKLIKHLHTKVTKKIKVIDNESGKEYSLPEQTQELSKDLLNDKK